MHLSRLGLNNFKIISKSIRKQNSLLTFTNHYNHSTLNILGIETSCDDTGCAIINTEGQLLSEVLHSQNPIHLRHGGIIPDIAQDLHRNHIESVVNKTLEFGNLSMQDISYIAVTLKPGLPLSLAIGKKYAKYLSRRFDKPIIPIHHMEAHALAVRMHHDVRFPFLTLLISGGHCLLAIARDVNHFLLLGESIDCAPGEVFDKVARRLKLRNIPELSTICGGQAIEALASKATNPHQFKLMLPLAERFDCDFSFNGLKTMTFHHILMKENEHNIVANKLIPEVNDVCAAILMAVTRHLVHRTQRAMEFCELKNLLPENNKQLVVSGGVACNNYIFNALSVLCEDTGYKIFRPPPKLCTDNGVMIAWNGLEKYRKNIDIVKDVKSLDIEASSPLGESIQSEVVESRIPVKLMKMKLNTN